MQAGADGVQAACITRGGCWCIARADERGMLTVKFLLIYGKYGIMAKMDTIGPLDLTGEEINVWHTCAKTGYHRITEITERKRGVIGQ